MIGVFNGLVNMILSSLGSIYQFQYGFPPTTAGLTYVGLGMGGLLGLFISPILFKYFGRKWESSDNSNKPEISFLVMLVAGPLTSVGLLWYGWCLHTKAFWFVPILGLFIFGFGYMGMRVC